MTIPGCARRAASHCGRASLLLVTLVLGISAASVRAQTIPNPSFETDTFTVGNGFVSDNTPITGWTANPTNMVGLNTTGTIPLPPFADNGATPHGTKVAFLRSTGGTTSTLSTTITGLTVGKTYRVQFRANRMVTGGTVAPEPAYRLNGGPAVPFYMGLGVGGSEAYRTINGLFIATATTAALEVSNTTAGDSFLLVDNFLITAATVIQVMNTNDAVVPPAGSLRKALADAQASAVPNVITFAPALNGATINLTSQITLNDPNGVCIDASAHANKITIVPTDGVRHFFNSVGSLCAMRNLRLENANVSLHAGAILNDGVLDLTQCWFSGNVTAGTGAAVYNGNVISMTDCLFVGNTSSVAGGGLLHQGASATVTRCTFMNNRGIALGGAVYATAPGLSFTACTFTGNTSDDRGGAIFLDQSAVAKLTHCTISENTAAYGGGITNRGTITVKNCIIAENTATINGTTADVENNSSVVGVTFTREGANIIQAYANTSTGTDSGPAAIDDDPELAGILENGGPTPTMAIAPDSPARDAAVDSTAIVDQRGKPMLGVADIGAFELQQGIFSFGSATFRVSEGLQAQILINRTEAAGAVTVRVTSTPGTATSPADFAATSTDVTFDEGDLSKTVPIQTVLDTLTEANQTFTVTLSFPSPTNASLGSPTKATVTITDPIQVTNLNDDGPGSLRQAFVSAKAIVGGDTIQFATALNGKTVTLGSDIVVDDPQVVVNATTLAGGIIIDAGPGTNRIFTVNHGSVLSLWRLTLTGGNGNDDRGGAIDNSGVLSLTECTLSGNTSPTFGGAIFNVDGGDMFLQRCTLSGNTAVQSGGAIYIESDATPAAVQLNQCTLSANSASTGEGGAIYSVGDRATCTLIHCTVSKNTANTLGGGVFSDSGLGLFVFRTIISGNTATGTPASADLHNAAGGLLVRSGVSFVTTFQHLGAPLGGGGSFSIADPHLLPLAANGGPTRTHALDSDSPARNAASGSTFTTDQRGVAVLGVPDVGAYELQNGGVFSLEETSYSAVEGSPISVTVKRNSGAGIATVRVITTAGSASAGADFTARPNTDASLVTFPDGVASVTITPDIATDPGTGIEPNEFFTISLSNPSAGATLGTPSSAHAVIKDSAAAAADGSFPSATITFPAQGQVFDVPVGGKIVVTGTATDNQGVVLVQVDDVAGANSGPATLHAPDAASTTWSFEMTPVAGQNGLFAAVSDALNTTPGINPPRAFTVRRPLLVNISGNGSVTSGFSPQSYREVGKSFTITATPGAGSIFAGWTILSSHTFADLGAQSNAGDKPTLTGLFREGLALRANFVPNPYPALASAKGTEYSGLIHADPDFPDREDPEVDGTEPSLATEGHLKITLMSSGAFSGVIKMDGGTLTNINGTFDHEGNARFGPARATTLTVARPGKPSFIISYLNIDLDPGRSSDSIYGEIIMPGFKQSVITGQSYVFADRAYYDGLTPDTTVHPDYLGAAGATQTYTVILPPADNTYLGYEFEDYPQGFGYATCTISKAGVVTIIGGKLADSTTFTATMRLAKDDFCPLFVQLYTGLKGFISGDIWLDSQNTISDMTAQLWWVRPVDTTQHYYPNGWQVPIDLGLLGARYSPTFTPPSSVLRRPDSDDDDALGDPLLPVDPVEGNATLSFMDGLLTEPIDKPINVDTKSVMTKVVTNDGSFTLTIVPNTGAFSGKFVHENDDGVPKPAMTDFQGIIYQKCLVSGAYGYFLTRRPSIIDFTGQSGLVTIIGHEPPP